MQNEEQIHIVWKILANACRRSSRFAMLLIGLGALTMSAFLFASMADRLQETQNLGIGRAELYKFRVPEVIPPLSACRGELCAVAATVPHLNQVKANADTVLTAARIVLPPPVLIEANDGAILTAVGIADEARPLAERNYRDEATSQGGQSAAAPLLLAREAHGNKLRNIEVAHEGFAMAWTTIDMPAQAAPIRWQPPSAQVRQQGSTRDARQRRAQWLDLKLRTLLYQPVPGTFSLVIPNSADTARIALGDFMVMDWSRRGAISDPAIHQLTPRNGLVGVVVDIQSHPDNVTLQVSVPRRTAYGSSHWLWLRLNDLQKGEQVVPSEVTALFFKPTGLPQGTDSRRWALELQNREADVFSVIERAFSELARVPVHIVPASALDAACATPTAPENACVWTALNGVAVPVQVRVLPMGSLGVGVEERRVFAGKAIAATHWAKMPVAVRRSLIGRGNAAAGHRASILLNESPIFLRPLSSNDAGASVKLVLEKNQ